MGIVRGMGALSGWSGLCGGLLLTRSGRAGLGAHHRLRLVVRVEVVLITQFAGDECGAAAFKDLLDVLAYAVDLDRADVHHGLSVGGCGRFGVDAGLPRLASTQPIVNQHEAIRIQAPP